MRGRAVFATFYEQLKAVRNFHRKYPGAPVSHEPNLDDALHPTVTVRSLGVLSHLLNRLLGGSLAVLG